MRVDRSALTVAPEALDGLLEGQLRRLRALGSGDLVDQALSALVALGAGCSPSAAAVVLAPAGLSVPLLLGCGFLAERAGGREPILVVASPRMRMRLERVGERAWAAVADLCVEALLTGAVDAVAHSNWDSAHHHLQRVSAIAERQTDLRLQVRVLAEIARVHLRQRDPEGVDGCATRLVALGRHAPLVTALATTQASLWRGVASCLRRDTQAALLCAREASQASSSLGDKVLEGEALALLGEVLFDSGDTAGGAQALEQAHQLFAGQCGEAHGWWARHLAARNGDAVRLLAEAQMRKGDFIVSAGFARLALRICRDSGDAHGEALSFLQLTRALRRGAALRTSSHSPHELDEEVRRHLHRTERLFEALDDRRGHAVLVWEKACLDMEEGRYNDAMETFADGGGLFGSVGDAFSASLCRNAEGEASRRAGRPDHAEACYLDFLLDAERSGNPVAVGVACTNLGWNELARGASGAGIGWFVRASRSITDGHPQERFAALIGRVECMLTEMSDPNVVRVTQDLAQQVPTPIADRDARASLERVVSLCVERGLRGLAEQLARAVR